MLWRILSVLKNMKRVGFAVLCLGTVVSAQPPETLWVREYGIGAGDMVQSSIFATPDGGVVFTAVQANEWGYVVKYDSSGNQLWNVPTYINDEVGGIKGLYKAIPVSNDRILAVGWGYYQPGWPRAITILYSANGDTIWRRAFDNEQSEVEAGAEDCIEREDGSFIVVGTGRRDTDPLTPVIPFVVCYSPEGEELWHQYYHEGSRQHTDGISVFKRIEGGIGLTTYTSYPLPTPSEFRTWAQDDTGAVIAEQDMFEIGLGHTGIDPLRTIVDSSYVVAHGAASLARFDADLNLIWNDATTLSWIEYFFVASPYRESEFLIAGITQRFQPEGLDKGLLIRMNLNRDTVWTKVFVDPDTADHSAVPRAAVGTDGSIYAVYDVGITGAHVVLTRLGRDTLQTSSAISPPTSPLEISLNSIYPNPFNSSTEFSFEMPRVARATINVYDVLGREQATLLNDVVQAGARSVMWNAEGFASGIYFVRLSVGDVAVTKKVALVK